MKGKKVDNEFLSKFINECLNENINSSNDIVNLAKDKILSIDNKIKEVENLKLLRSKLLDVIYTFDKSYFKILQNTKS